MRDPALFFQPAIYEHAAAVIQRTPWQVSRDKDLLVQAHAAAFQKYRHTPITVGIDIYNPEAEAYGATVNPVQGNDIPTISQPLFDAPEQILSLAAVDPWHSGRLSLLIEAGKELARLFPQEKVRIPVSGPFSIASLLLGFESLLMAVLTDTETLAEALQHLARLQNGFLTAIYDAQLQATLFESAATPPLISPQLFRQIEFPALHKLVAHVKTLQGSAPALIIGGDTAVLADDLCATGAGYLICPAETDQALFMKNMARHPEVMVRINMHSRIVATASRQEITQEVDRVLALASNRERVCIGTGVLPYETLPENVFFISELCRHHA
jgi:uroporphyrinogen decarboxylase